MPIVAARKIVDEHVVICPENVRTPTTDFRRDQTRSRTSIEASRAALAIPTKQPVRETIGTRWKRYTGESCSTIWSLAENMFDFADFAMSTNI